MRSEQYASDDDIRNIDEGLQVLGVSFVSLTEGIDATTPAGKFQMRILGAIAEFERGRLRERVAAGLARARREGTRLGRPRCRAPADLHEQITGLSVRAPRLPGNLASLAQPCNGGWPKEPLELSL